MSTVILVKRVLWMPKSVWRSAQTRRTLPSMETETLIQSILRRLHKDLKTPALVEVQVSTDNGEPRIEKILEANCPSSDQLLNFKWNEEGGIDVVLREEGCLRAVGVPRRSTRRIAILQPWRPMRIILNGFFGGYHERWYCLSDRLMILCDHEPPQSLVETHVVDLQGDLV